MKRKFIASSIDPSGGKVAKNNLKHKSQNAKQKREDFTHFEEDIKQTIDYYEKTKKLPAYQIFAIAINANYTCRNSCTKVTFREPYLHFVDEQRYTKKPVVRFGWPKFAYECEDIIQVSFLIDKILEKVTPYAYDVTIYTYTENRRETLDIFKNVKYNLISLMVPYKMLYQSGDLDKIEMIHKNDPFGNSDRRFLKWELCERDFIHFAKHHPNITGFEFNILYSYFGVNTIALYMKLLYAFVKYVHYPIASNIFTIDILPIIDWRDCKEKKVIREIEAFHRIILDGLGDLKKGSFHKFLCHGLYDPRLLIFIMNFIYF